MNTGNYTINALKTFNGMEGGGYNCNLLRDGKKVAEVIDDATGGEVRFHWLDERATPVKGSTRNYKDETVERSMTPEEAKFYAHVMTLPAEKQDFTGDDGKAVMMFPSDGMFIESLVCMLEVEKKLKRMLSGSAVYIQNGSIYTSKRVPTEAMPKVLAAFKEKKPELALLNNMPFADALAQFAPFVIR